MLTLRDVTVDYRRGRLSTRALNVDRLDVPASSIVGVIGETGSGKTTLVRAILGLAPLGGGAIELDGAPISGLRGERRREFLRSGSVRYLHQDTLGSLDPGWSIARSLGEPFTVGLRTSRPSRDEVRRRIGAAFELLGLDEALLDHRPAALSGGQRQRVNLARAIMFEPRLLLLDEPTSALDALNRALVVDGLHRLRDVGVSTLVISHDLTSLFDVVDRIVVLYRGRIVEQSDMQTLLTAPEHPYTRLLLASVPTLFGEAITPAERRALRADVDALADRS